MYFVKCPNCAHIFDHDETFSWGADSDGHPTMEQIYCPKCYVGTEPHMTCDRCPGSIQCNLNEECAACLTYGYDDFKEAEPEPHNDPKTDNQSGPVA